MNRNSYSPSSNTFKGIGNVFENNNGIVMNFAFTIFVVIVFIIMYQLIINIIRRFYLQTDSPFLFRGIVDGKQLMTYDQDPTKSRYAVIKQSKNKDAGIEFTWSFWINIEDLDHNKGKYKHIFHKGEAKFEHEDDKKTDTVSIDDIQYEPNIINSKDDLITTNGLNFPNNSPGVYIAPNSNKLVIFMNTFENLMEQIIIDDIPMQKWVNVIIRCENKTIDVYINGSISRRHVLKSVPKQNHGNVYTGMNGGFDGHLSNLKYYSESIGTREIENIITEGINTKNFSPRPTRDDNANYISTSWFSATS